MQINYLYKVENGVMFIKSGQDLPNNCIVMLLHCFDKVTVMVFSKGLPNGGWDIIIAHGSGILEKYRPLFDKSIF